MAEEKEKAAREFISRRVLTTHPKLTGKLDKAWTDETAQESLTEFITGNARLLYVTEAGES